MIIDVDHIAFNSNNSQDDLISSYEFIFSREDILNPPEKKAFLRQYLPNHSLFFYKSPGNKSVPIEITNHGSIDSSVQSPNAFKGNTLLIPVQNLVSEIDLLKKIGFIEKDNNELFYSGLLLKCGLSIQLLEMDSKIDYFLDDIGITCLAFISTNLQFDIEKIKNNIVLLSDEFTIDAGNKKLNIQICKSKNGFYYEFIKVLKNENN